jgi:hypothetical protein
VNLTNEVLVDVYDQTLNNELSAEGEASKKFYELLLTKDLYITIDGGTTKYKYGATVPFFKDDTKVIKLKAFKTDGVSFSNTNTEWTLGGTTATPNVLQNQLSELNFTLNTISATKKGFDVRAKDGDIIMLIYVVVVDIDFVKEPESLFPMDFQDNGLEYYVRDNFDGQPYIAHAQLYPSYTTSPISGLFWKPFKNGVKDRVRFEIKPPDSKEFISLAVSDPAKFEITGAVEGSISAPPRHTRSVELLPKINGTETDFLVKLGTSDERRVKLKAYKMSAKKICVIL